MCGISIVISKRNEQIPKHVIKQLNDKVIHRGPNDEGFYFDENFAFGHRRLSVIDLGSAGRQPIEKSGLVINYNGEIYNYIELRNELISLGHQFQTDTDTEVILEAYRQWGTEAFSRLNGMWAFALADKAKNEIILCRDHFGIKPLYWTETENYFLAGSEIKQFTDVEDFERVLNKGVAINFLVSGLLNYSSETFFENVNDLRPGYFMKYNFKTLDREIVQWYDLAKALKTSKEEYSVAVKKVRDVFNDSVRIRMRSDVPVGSSLSGGIDSSSIATAIYNQKLAHRDFTTITCCFKEANYDEQKYSDKITEQTGFKGAKIYPDLNRMFSLGHLDKMIYHHDQPLNGGTHYLEFCVYEAAMNQKMTVMQSGQGSDEFLCGYDEFFETYVRELIGSFRFGKAIKLLRTRSLHKHTDLKREILTFFSSRYLPKLISLLKFLTGIKPYPWLNTDWQKLARKSALNFKGDSVKGLSYIQMKRSSLPYQLHSEDRNSMMHSIECRLPFLDNRFVEYCMSLPSDFKIKDGFTKAVFRDAIVELPEIVKNRKHKMGFMSPDASWMLSNAAKIRVELEDAISKTGIFNSELLGRFDRFVEGELGYESLYFRVIALNRFCQIFKMKIN